MQVVLKKIINCSAAERRSMNTLKPWVSPPQRGGELYPKKLAGTIKRLLITVLALLYTVFSVFTIHAATFKQKISEPSVEAGCAVLIDAATGFVLYDKNGGQKAFPASTTKIMTALLTLEYAKGDYSERIKFSENAVFGIEPGSSHIAMDVDETLTLGEALYAIMLASANEVSAALAEHIGGSIEGFADMMNARAKELGALNTHFVNPHGLDDENHFTTARDLALIMREAVKHDQFLKVIATKQTEIPPTEKQPEPRPLYNSNDMIFDYEDVYYEDLVGGKTGYTDTSRHTLVSYAERGERKLIAVIMRGEKNVPYTDSIALYDYGFSIYDDVKVLDKNDYKTEVTVYSDENTTRVIELVPRADITVALPQTVGTADIVKKPVYETASRFHIEKGEPYGVVQLIYNGTVVGETELVISGITEKPAPRAHESADSQTVFNAMQEETASKGAGFSGTAVLIAVAVLLALSAALIYRSYRLRKRRLSRRRCREIGARGYRYRDHLNDYRGR